MLNRPKCEDMGKVIERWNTGDDECNAYSERYECGAVYGRIGVITWQS